MSALFDRVQANLSLTTAYLLAASILGLLTIYGVYTGDRTLGLLPDLPLGLNFPSWDQQSQAALASTSPFQSQTWGDVVAGLAGVLMALGGALAGQEARPRELIPPTRPAGTVLIAAAAMQQAAPAGGGGWLSFAIPILLGLAAGAMVRGRHQPGRYWASAVPSELLGAFIDLLFAIFHVIVLPLLFALTLADPPSDDDDKPVRVRIV